MKTTPNRPARPFERVAFTLLFAGFVLLGLANRAAGQGLVPERLSFQGYMEDANSAPLGATTPTNYPVVFRIFSAAAGGTTNWSERQTVTFDKGSYSVILGQGSANGSEPHPLLSTVVMNAVGSQLYVETTVTINGVDAKILPRLQLLPTPYAFLATRAVSATTADQALSVNGSAISAGSIPQDRLSDSFLSNIFVAPIADSRLSTNITMGPIADSRLSTNITMGPIDESRLPQGGIADSRLSTNVALRGEANAFTGNQTINGNAVVNGSVTITNNLNLGTVGQYKVAVGEESLRIVRGQVRLLPEGTQAQIANGARPVQGTGFTVARLPADNTVNPVNSVVRFEITFVTPFADIPTVTVTPVRDTESAGYGYASGFQTLWGFGRIESAEANKVIVAFQVPGSITLDVPFSFIAVGPR